MNVPRVESSTAARSQQRSQTFPRQGSLQGPSSRRLSVKLNAPNALNTAPSLNSRKGKARDRPLPGVQFGRRTANAERKWHSKSCTELTTSALSETVVPEAEEQNIPLEKRLTNEKLRHLEQVFHEADEDGGGRLGMDKFRIIMRQAMGDHLTNQELDIIFLSYMLLQHLQKDYISQAMQEKPLPKVPRFVPNMNRYQSFNDYIVQIQNMPIPCPRPRHARHGSRGHWREIRVGHQRRRGPFWTMAMKHVKRFKLEAPPRSVGPWVVDTVYMSKVHMVVITTTAATITFYDLTTKFEPIKVVTALEVRRYLYRLLGRPKGLQTFCPTVGRYQGQRHCTRVLRLFRHLLPAGQPQPERYSRVFQPASERTILWSQGVQGPEGPR